MTSKRDLALWKSSSSPPTMIERVPSLAPTSPPETGLSSILTPLALARRANCRARRGEEVLMSTMREPSLAPSSFEVPSSSERPDGLLFLGSTRVHLAYKGTGHA